MLDLSQCWTEQPAVVVIDFETCGLQPSDGAVEIACLRFEGQVLTSKFTTFLNPGRPIPQEATAIHQITDAMLAGAPTLADCAGDILAVCRDAIPCAYSAPFDRAFLHHSITGKDCPAFDPEFPGWLDPLVYVRDRDKHVSGSGKNKLTAACQRWGVEMEHAHRAMCDASATAALLFAMMAKGALPKMPLGKMLARTERRRVIQEQKFAEWLASRPAARSA